LEKPPTIKKIHENSLVVLGSSYEEKTTNRWNEFDIVKQEHF
jgi:hypothetical protein